MDAKKIKLKPCPFCGKIPEMVASLSKDIHKVQCCWYACRMNPSSPLASTAKEAAANWNRRKGRD